MTQTTIKGMKTAIEKIVEEREKAVFRLDLIPESKEDEAALANLGSNELDVTDLMIQSIVEQNANKLLKAQGNDWKIERVEKKKGFNSYYIHLRMLKLVSIPIDYPDSEVGADENKEIEDIILFHLFKTDGRFSDEDITNVLASFGLKVSYERLKSICEKLGSERKIVWRESANSIIAKMIFAGSKYATDNLFPLTANQAKIPFDQLSFYLKKIKIENEFETEDVDNGEGVLIKYVPKGKYSDYYIRIIRIKFLFFSVVSSPSIKVANRKNFDSVTKGFIQWINYIRNENETSNIPNINNAKGVLLTEGPSTLDYRNDTIKPSLNVDLQVDIFFKLLNAISSAKNETGLLLGVFGKWGRGKTFFWKQLVKKFTAKSELQFDHVEFHAWKYQDTPASWAYLYEVFADKYYRSGTEISNFYNRIRLNKKRLGSFKFYGYLTLFVIGIIWYFFLSFKFKINLFITLIGAFGSVIIGALMFYNSFSGLAKDFFKSYFSRISFGNLLGVQAEIHKELVTLLKTWIPEVGKKRIILFVDDIDRCDETRIIEVIDSLKIMIDSPEVSDRVIVIAAIDESVLKRAIKQKYFNLITNDLSLSGEEKKSELERLCREYLDKLFINGFRLSSLASDDRIKLFNDLTEKQIFYRNDKNDITSSNPEAADTVQTTIDRQVKKVDVVEPKSSYDDYIALQPNDKFELMDYEADKLQKALLKYKDVTPRSLRIFYYRYLLAKEFINLTIGNRDSAKYLEWQKNDHQKVLLPYLLVVYAKEKSHSDLLKEIESIEAKPLGLIEVSCLKEKFQISKDLYLSLLKIIETVVPY